ncbi:MAG: thioredoxin family protein [Candidatus Aminicenantaceae bacterium]
MEMLNKEVIDATTKKFNEELESPVTFLFFTQEPSRLVLPEHLKGQECLYCKEVRQLLEEVSSLSDKINLTIYDFVGDKEKAAEYGIDKIPAIVVMGEEDFGIRFFGIPSGYEYASLIEAIIDASKGKTSLSQKTKDSLKAINKDIHIQVFVTPTCPYCPMAVRLGHQFALESPHIKADMVESSEFPHLSQKYNVFGVPKTIINEKTAVEGAVPEETFLEHVLKAFNPPEEKEKENQQKE